MTYAAGIDIGSTCVRAAILVDGIVEVVRLGTDSPHLPAVAAFTAHGDQVLGNSAAAILQCDPTSASSTFRAHVSERLPIVVAGRLVLAADVCAAFIGHVIDRLTMLRGEPPDAVVVNRPCGWATSAVRRVLQSLASAEVAISASFVAEPGAVAAAHEFEMGHASGTAAVLDLGGTTSTVALVREGGVVGRSITNSRLGGVDLDDVVLGHVLSNVTVDLDASVDDSAMRQALSRLRVECVRAKIALSSNTYADVGIQLPDIVDRVVRITRSEFEEGARPVAAAVVSLLADCLQVNDVDVADVDTIVLAGGSAYVPLLAHTVSNELRRPVVRLVRPELGVVTGLVLHAAQRAARLSSSSSSEAAGSDSSTLLSEGNMLREARRLAEAETTLTRAIAARRSEPLGWALRGDVRRLQGSYIDALADLDHALSLDSTCPPALAWRAATLRTLRRYAAALRDLDLLVELRPRCAWAFALRGSVHLTMNDRQLARLDLNRALTIDQHHAFALGQRGYLNKQEGRADEAMDDLSRSLTIEPTAWVAALRRELADAHR